MSALLRSARFRVTVQATAIVAVALLLGAMALLWLLASNLSGGVEATLADRADARVRLIEANVDPATFVSPSGDETFVWIGLDNGVLLAAGGDALTDPASVLRTAGSDLVVRSIDVDVVETDYDEEYGLGGDDNSDHEGDHGDGSGEADTEEVETQNMRVVGAIANAPSSGTVHVLAGSNLDRVDSTLRTARNLLLFGLPLAIALVAAVAWISLGRAFGPVEKLRTGADEISGARLDDRLPRSGSGDEIDRLGETMNRMLDRLSEHDQRQKQFTSDASHELKTPVANLRAIVETSNPADEPWEDIRSRLVGEAERMTALVDDLLFVSTRDERGPADGRGTVHLDDLVFDEAAALKSRCSARIDVSEVAPATVVGDAADLRRAIRNLADNAGRYATSVVAFRVEEAGTSVTVSVADDGPGIAAKDREAVFERFGRTDEARDRAIGGTGLGLAIVREIIGSHNGTVAISHTLTGVSPPGTTVSMSLPSIDVHRAPSDNGAPPA